MDEFDFKPNIDSDAMTAAKKAKGIVVRQQRDRQRLSKMKRNSSGQKKEIS